MKTSSKRQSNRWIALGLGLGAFVLYVATLSRGAFPGDSAFLVSKLTGLFPLLLPESPIWRAVAAVIGWIPGGTYIFRLNLFSALCGAVSVGLLYRIVTDAIWASLDAAEIRHGRARTAAQSAGIGAALFLAGSVPFWVVSNRAHTASFDVMLLLMMVALLMSYARAENGRVRLLVLALLYGAGVAEFATFILFFALVGPLVVYLMWRKGHLTVPMVLLALGAGLLGMGTCLLSAWAFLDDPGFQLRSYTGFWNVVFQIWRGQYLLLARSLPVSGWLLILILTVIPWLAAVGLARRALNGECDWAYYFLHFVMTVLVVSTLFNVRLAPWPMLGMQHLLVTPYVLAAATFGYLLAYWYLVFASPRDGGEAPEGWRLRSGIARLTVSLGLGALLVATGLNWSDADARRSAQANRYANAVLDHLDGRTWLVTDGSLDFNIQLAAQARGVPLKIISLGWAQSRVLLDHAANSLGDLRYRNAARLGMAALLKDWLASGDAVLNDVALMSNPDLWTQAGLMPVPHGLVFVGRRTVAPGDAGELLAYHERAWRDLAWLQQLPTSGEDAFAPLWAQARRHSSLVANNLGVLLEDLGARREAATAYQQSLAFADENISALLNLHVLITDGVIEDREGGVKKSLEALASTLEDRKERIWELAGVYGFVRSPQAFADLGWYWAATGQPGMAASGLRKAMALLPEEQQGGVKQALADLYLLQERPKESEALYYELLVEDPENQKALLGMARLEMMRGRATEARGYLDRAKAVGVPDILMALEWAAVDLQSGHPAEARQKLEQVIKERPELTRAWGMLVALLVQQNDEEGLAASIRRMESNQATRGFLLSIARAHLAVMRNDLDGARYGFEEARRFDPGNVAPLEWLLRLDMVQNMRAEAERHAVDILRVDSGHGLGNYVMATLHIHAGEYALAKDSLQRSIARQNSPNALNDLAWLLAESGLYAEAELHARAALKIRPGLPQALDTLGFILFKTGRLVEAEASYKQALVAAPRFADPALHLAELYMQSGAPEKAGPVLSALEQRRTELTTEQDKRLSTLLTTGK